MLGTCARYARQSRPVDEEAQDGCRKANTTQQSRTLSRMLRHRMLNCLNITNVTTLWRRL